MFSKTRIPLFFSILLSQKIHSLLLSLDAGFPEKTQNIFQYFRRRMPETIKLNHDPLAGFIQSFYSTDGWSAKHQAHILRSLILFVLLFNKMKTRTSLTLCGIHCPDNPHWMHLCGRSPAQHCSLQVKTI